MSKVDTRVSLRRTSDLNPFHLIERDGILVSIVKLGCPGRLVSSDRLSILQCASGFEISSDSSSPKRVAGRFGIESRLWYAFLNYLKNVLDSFAFRLVDRFVVLETSRRVGRACPCLRG